MTESTLNSTAVGYSVIRYSGIREGSDTTGSSAFATPTSYSRATGRFLGSIFFYFLAHNSEIQQCRHARENYFMLVRNRGTDVGQICEKKNALRN